jgi:hypothetical protein
MSPFDANQMKRLGMSLRREGAVFLIVFAAVLAHLPSLWGRFFKDDYIYVAQNNVLLSVPLAQAWRFFTERTNAFEFLPLRDLSYRLDVALFGLDPFGFHIHNLVLYAICCGTVWFCVRAILRLFSASAKCPSLLDPDRLAWIAAAFPNLVVRQRKVSLPADFRVVHRSGCASGQTPSRDAASPGPPTGYPRPIHYLRPIAQLEVRGRTVD